MSSSPPIAHKPKLDPSSSRRPPPASLWVWAADRWPVSDIIKVSGIGHSPEYDIFPAPLGRGYTGSSSPTAHELLSQPSSKGAGSDSALLRVALKTIGNLPTSLPTFLPTYPSTSLLCSLFLPLSARLVLPHPPTHLRTQQCLLYSGIKAGVGWLTTLVLVCQEMARGSPVLASARAQIATVARFNL